MKNGRAGRERLAASASTWRRESDMSLIFKPPRTMRRLRSHDMDPLDNELWEHDCDPDEE